MTDWLLVIYDSIRRAVNDRAMTPHSVADNESSRSHPDAAGRNKNLPRHMLDARSGFDQSKLRQHVDVLQVVDYE